MSKNGHFGPKSGVLAYSAIFPSIFVIIPYPTPSDNQTFKLIFMFYSLYNKKGQPTISGTLDPLCFFYPYHPIGSIFLAPKG